MSETNWTPGPWEVDEEARVGGYGIEATPSAYTHVTVAVSIQSEGCAYPISSAEARNNARLIASAPELYQALEKACKETEHFQFEAWLVTESPSGDCEEVQRKWLESSDYKDFIHEWRDQLDVLAKARGES